MTLYFVSRRSTVKNDLSYFLFSVNWRAQGDDFRTFLADFVAALPTDRSPRSEQPINSKLSQENQQGCAGLSSQLI
jgi:hypothetical protein